MTPDATQRHLRQDRGKRRWGCRTSPPNDIMDLVTSWRHLFSAVLRLGADEGTVDQRLREAHQEIARMAANPGLPDQLHAEYAKLMSELDELFRDSSRPDMRRASRLAKRVVALYDRVSREL